MNTFESLTLFFAVLTGLGSFIAWIINGHRAESALIEARKASELARQANELAKEANLLSKGS